MDISSANSDANMHIQAFLGKHRTGILATVDPHSHPYAAVIYYSIDASFVVRFLSKRDTKKSINLVHNNHVMLIVYDELTQTIAHITGEAIELSQADHITEVFRQTVNASATTSDTHVPPISKLDAGEYVAYEIRPSDIRMTVYVHKQSGSNELITEHAILD